MKRSKINQCIRDMEKLIRENGFHLPDFCSWTPEEWKGKGHEYDEIRDNMLGWDITDYGLGDWNKVGFALITLRNGNQHDPKYKKVYAEKLLMLKEGQHSPMHFHWTKSEDIINRGGGNVLIRVYHSTPDEDLDREREVHVHVDGREMVVPAGTQVRQERSLCGDKSGFQPEAGKWDRADQALYGHGNPAGDRNGRTGK